MSVIENIYSDMAKERLNDVKSLEAVLKEADKILEKIKNNNPDFDASYKIESGIAKALFGLSKELN